MITAAQTISLNSWIFDEEEKHQRVDLIRPSSSALPRRPEETQPFALTFDFFSRSSSYPCLLASAIAWPTLLMVIRQRDQVQPVNLRGCACGRRQWCGAQLLYKMMIGQEKLIAAVVVPDPDGCACLRASCVSYVMPQTPYGRKAAPGVGKATNQTGRRRSRSA